MSGKKKHPVFSFRIDEEYEKVLRGIAEENKISLNTLANQFLEIMWNLRFMLKSLAP